MGAFEVKWRSRIVLMMIFVQVMLGFTYVCGETSFNNNHTTYSGRAAANYNVPPPPQSGYHHVWPALKFGWRIVVGSIIGMFGASFGSVGGVGGGGIFVPMLSLIIGFDTKSATALSKCMITGAAASTVYYNIKLRHPTLEMPMIDYDLALLIQPMLMLGISIGVAFNVLFADWMLTVLLIFLFIGISTKAYFKGVKTWKKETIIKAEAAIINLQSNSNSGKNHLEVDCNPPADPPNGTEKNNITKKSKQVTLVENIYWMKLGILIIVWVAFLGLQIAKNHTTTCSITYWVLNSLQIPVSVSVSVYQAISLYKGKRSISSRSNQSQLKVHQLALYCAVGVAAGILGGLLGLGGGFIMVPLFLEIGIPPQVSSATATFTMTFSSSMAVVEYYLIKRFPIPYALYLAGVATIAALAGQHIVTKIINLIGRASIIIFILAITIFASALFLGGTGISNLTKKIERHEYMGFEQLCEYNG